MGHQCLHRDRFKYELADCLVFSKYGWKLEEEAISGFAWVVLDGKSAVT